MTRRFSFWDESNADFASDRDGNIYFELSEEHAAHEELSGEHEPREMFLPDSPASVFIPDQYEKGYAYPLVVWFHDRGGSEEELHRVMPLISERNYFGVSLRGTASHSQGGFHWKSDPHSMMDLEFHLSQALTELHEDWHLHPERIYLAGINSGASIALRLMFQRPEWFAGATVLGGKLPDHSQLGLNYRHLPGKRLNLGMSTRQGKKMQTELQHKLRLLHTTGMTVEIENDRGRSFEASARSAAYLAQMNEWIMQGIASATFV